MAIIYPERYKREMVDKMLPPDAESAGSLSRRSGVAQSTLSNWLRDAKSDSLSGMKNNSKKQHIEAKNHSKKQVKNISWGDKKRKVSLDDKLQIILEATSTNQQELGAFLRTHGLHESDLAQYQEDLQLALSEVKEFVRKENKYKKNLKKMERELNRKEKALAEAAALLVLKKKVQSIWGEEEDDYIQGKNDL
jgi:transposase